MPAQSGSGGTKHPNGATMAAARSGATLDDLALFARVARHASFVEVSRRTGVPTSTVSRAVARLEDQLGVRLMHRTTRKVVLTREGSELAQRVASHLEGLEEALASTAEHGDEPSGVVRVTAPAYTGSTRVARALASFARAHPRVTIALDASNAVRDLLDDGYDFGIRVGPVVHADFIARKWWTGSFGLFATRAFLRSIGARTVVTREALDQGPCIVGRAEAVWRFRDSKGARVVLSPRARFTVSDPRAALEAGRQDLGFVLAPVDAVPDGDPLVPIRADFGEPEPLDLYLVYPTRRLQPERVRMAIEWLFKPEHTGPPPRRG